MKIIPNVLKSLLIKYDFSATIKLQKMIFGSIFGNLSFECQNGTCVMTIVRFLRKTKNPSQSSIILKIKIEHKNVLKILSSLHIELLVRYQNKFGQNTKLDKIII